MNTAIEQRHAMPRAIATCFARTVVLLVRRRLHIHHARVGRAVHLDDGRDYVVFRETSCDTPHAARSSLQPRGSHRTVSLQTGFARPVTLVVWFRLRAIPPGARVRRWLFERACIVNTMLFAGVPGYLVKLWMVNPATSDYAGLYSWRSAEEAERYGRYITSILRPLSVERSIGFVVVADRTLDEYLGDVPLVPDVQDAKKL